MNIRYLWLKLRIKNNWGSGLVFASTIKKGKLERFIFDAYINNEVAIFSGNLTVPDL